MRLSRRRRAIAVGGAVAVAVSGREAGISTATAKGAVAAAKATAAEHEFLRDPGLELCLGELAGLVKVPLGKPLVEAADELVVGELAVVVDVEGGHEDAGEGLADARSGTAGTAGTA